MPHFAATLLVYHSEHSVRLYDNAQKRQARLEARRAAEARAHGEELRAARASSHMTDISRAIMRGRRPGQGQGSYGGMLYEEGLEAQRERQRRVGAACMLLGKAIKSGIIHGCCMMG